MKLISESRKYDYVILDENDIAKILNFKDSFAKEVESLNNFVQINKGLAFNSISGLIELRNTLREIECLTTLPSFSPNTYIPITEKQLCFLAALILGYDYLEIKELKEEYNR